MKMKQNIDIERQVEQLNLATHAAAGMGHWQKRRRRRIAIARVAATAVCLAALLAPAVWTLLPAHSKPNCHLIAAATAEQHVRQTLEAQA